MTCKQTGVTANRPPYFIGIFHQIDVCLSMFSTRHVKNICRSELWLTCKRYKFKPKWASSRQKKSPSEHALSYFDSFYPQVYGDLWPSIRLALLSQQKYSALLNHFSADKEDIVVRLVSNGSDNFVKIAADMESSESKQLEQGARRAFHAPEDSATLGVSPDEAPLNGDSENTDIERSQPHGGINTEVPEEEFMPVSRVYSEQEKLALMEEAQASYVPHQSFGGIPLIPDEGRRHLPHHLQVFSHGRRDISLFPSPKRDSNDKLGYFLMDAASILPVVALDLQPGDRVLDLCAAPGGKTLAMLQTMLPEVVVSVDSSYSRVKHMREMLKSYLPMSYLTHGMSQIVHKTGVDYSRRITEHFDKVLVDVPCFTDRHIVSEDDNNLFVPSRRKERLNIPGNQQSLLCAAIESCRPGGSVVYSTCTLSMSQNEGVIRDAIKQLAETSPGIEVAPVDISHIAQRFGETFNFFKRLHFGQLVVPNVTANFGPLYFCKLHRLK